MPLPRPGATCRLTTPSERDLGGARIAEEVRHAAERERIEQEVDDLHATARIPDGSTASH
jgi:hypothetical protein